MPAGFTSQVYDRVRDDSVDPASIDDDVTVEGCEYQLTEMCSLSAMVHNYGDAIIIAGVHQYENVPSVFSLVRWVWTLEEGGVPAGWPHPGSTCRRNRHHEPSFWRADYATDCLSVRGFYARQKTPATV